MTAPADILAMLDFAPGCLAQPDCRNAATHSGVATCCSEYVQAYCTQCRIEAIVSPDPWTCPRCGTTWTSRGKGFRWALLNTTAGGAK